MSRISIDVTPEEYQMVMALAALQKKSIKEFILSCILQSKDEDVALAHLTVILDKRIATARAGGVSESNVGEIFEGVYLDHDDRFESKNPPIS